MAKISRWKPRKMNPDSGRVIGYNKRQEILTELGFADYESYLASNLWQSIRGRVLERDGCKCKVCCGPSHMIHHIQYDKETMEGSSLRDLVTLCKRCHNRITITKEHKVRQIPDAYRELLKLCMWNRRKSPNHRRNRH